MYIKLSVMRWGSVAALLLLATAAAGADRVVRQATPSACSNGDPCLLLSGCPELLRLLRPPTREGIRRLRSLTCGYEGRRAKVCCPSPSVATPTPPSRTSPTPVTPAPPSGGEALLPQSCGHTRVGEKVHGGTPAPLGAYPWMAVLGYTRRGRGSVFWGCGGSLINSRYVLTAAHCTVRAMTNFLDLTRVRLGENHLTNDIDCDDRGCAPEPQDFSISSVSRHPQFNRRARVSDDVALLRLDRPVVPSGFIQPVCLPAPGRSLLDIIRTRGVTVTGFGDTEAGPRSQQLLQVVLPHVPMEACRRVANYNSTLAEEGQVCFGGQFQRDSCFKDSGGPAIVTRDVEGPPYVQVGVVSYGTESCGVEGVPAVYSDVTYYRRWIVDSLQP